MANLYESKRTYERANGQVIRLVREVAVVFNKNNPAEWGFDETEDQLAAGGYADDSAGPGDASNLKLNNKTIERDRGAAHIYRATCVYDQSQVSRESHKPNDEVIDDDLSTHQEQEYLDTSGDPVARQKSDVGHGFPRDVPGETIIVKRYHTLNYYWNTLRSAILACAGNLCSTSFTTPGDRELASAGGTLLCLGAQMREVQSDLCEVAYVLATDPGQICTDDTPTWTTRNFKHFTATINDDDVVTAVTGHNVVRQVSFASLMGTE